VNLFVPSVVAWRDKGLTLRQETRFPEVDTTHLTITVERPVRATVNVRHPSWTEGASVSVDGRSWEIGGGPGSYVTIEREWRSGDVVEVRLPMRLRAEALPGAPERVAFLYGPVVLAGRLGREGLYPGADILRNERNSGMVLDVPVEVPALAADPRTALERIRPVAGADPLTFETVGIGRPRDVQLVPYYRLHHERYNLYWELIGNPLPESE
jgi:hypothetical protein